MNKNIKNSKISKSKELILSKSDLVIKQLVFDARWARSRINQIKSKDEKITDEAITKILLDEIFENNYVIKLMQVALPNYKIDIDNTDLDAIVDSFLPKVDHEGKPIPKPLPHILEQFRNQAKNIIQGDLLYDELIKNEFKIAVSDDEAKEELNVLYKTKNLPIRDILNNVNGAFDNFKDSMIRKKLIELLKTKYQMDFDYAEINKQANALISQLSQIVTLYSTDLTLWKLIKNKVDTEINNKPKAS